MNCRTKIGKIECSDFEPIGGVDMLEFMDEFSVHSVSNFAFILILEFEEVNVISS